MRICDVLASRVSTIISKNNCQCQLIHCQKPPNSATEWNQIVSWVKEIMRQDKKPSRGNKWGKTSLGKIKGGVLFIVN
jgi:hypothetical protein